MNGQIFFLLFFSGVLFFSSVSHAQSRLNCRAFLKKKEWKSLSHCYWSKAQRIGKTKRFSRLQANMQYRYFSLFWKAVQKQIEKENAEEQFFVRQKSIQQTLPFTQKESCKLFSHCLKMKELVKKWKASLQFGLLQLTTSNEVLLQVRIVGKNKALTEDIQDFVNKELPPGKYKVHVSNPQTLKQKTCLAQITVSQTTEITCFSKELLPLTQTLPPKKEGKEGVLPLVQKTTPKKKIVIGPSSLPVYVEPKKTGAIALIITGSVLMLGGAGSVVWSALDQRRRQQIIDEQPNTTLSQAQEQNSAQSPAQQIQDLNQQIQIKNIAGYSVFGVGTILLVGGIVWFVKSKQTKSIPVQGKSQTQSWVLQKEIAGWD